MAPRRGTRKFAGVSTPTTPRAVSPPPLLSPQVGDQVTEAIAQWDADGPTNLHSLILGLLEPSSTSSSSLSSVPLSHVLITLLNSEVPQADVAEFLKQVFGELEEGGKETMGEVLVDVVEVLEEEREALGEGKAKEESEELSRGIFVINELINSKDLPTHIPNLLFNPERIAAFGIHPFQHLAEAPRNKALNQAFIKRNTALFFKQRKFNLLRECSEGFSGLIVLLLSGESLSPVSMDEDSESRRERAERVWAKVMGLIGYFNLSPPRVLDIILEIASCHVERHWRFFLELLKCTPWGAAAIEAEQKDKKGKGKEEDTWKEIEVESIRRALEEGGDRVLAQVLGFKFEAFRKVGSPDTPAGLTYIAAILVKHRFVNLADLVPFLSPSESEMADIRKEWRSSISSSSGPSNALTNTILVDDDAPAPSSGPNGTVEAAPEPTKPPPHQRIQLTHALLSLGDKASAEFMLGRYPWIAQSSTAVADLIIRLVEEAVEPVYEATREEDKYDLEAVLPVVETPPRQVVYTLISPVPPQTATTTFVFFYPGWDENREQWSSWEEIHEKGLRWLSLIRGLGGRRAKLMVKLCRIGVAHFARLKTEKLEKFGESKEDPALLEPTAEELKPWLDILRVSLLPSLSCSAATAAFDSELWKLLAPFPYTARYGLYGEWRDITCNPKNNNGCPVAANAAAQCTKETQKALRRVTSSSTSGYASTATQAERQSARSLAKLSHGNPIFLWQTAVNQVKAYPNIGEAIVDAGRYMGQLSFDVATFVILDTLSDDMALRLNETGTGVAFWLERLSKFLADINRRYSNMDLTPVLQYIINRLMRGHSGDLIILEKLMSSMSGVEPVPNDGVSPTQLQAYAGGREIIREAFSTTRISIAAPPEPGQGDQPKTVPVEKIRSIKKSLPRLVNALKDTGLAMPIWIGLAQTRQAVVDKLANTPMKAMNLVQDTTHNTFIQYGDFLNEYLSADDHVNTTSDLFELITEYNLEYGMAFQILRPRLTAEIDRAKLEDKATAQKRIQQAKRMMSDRSGSEPLSELSADYFAPPSPLSPVVATVPTPGSTLEGDDVAMEDGEKEKVAEQSVPAPKAASVKPRTVWWPAALTPTMSTAKKLLPKEVNEVMSAPFFVIFWHLTTPDISFSAESYNNAIKAINRHYATVKAWRVNTDNKSAVADQQGELARLRARVDVLNREKEAQAAAVVPNRRRLEAECSRWFGKSIVEKSQQRTLAFQLHQYCFYPRAILTPCDAVFVAKFIRTAHDLGTEGFSTLFAYNCFFSDTLAACIFSCTDSEARNLGRCLATILADLDGWHRDEKLYRKEALGFVEGVPEEEQKCLPGMLFRSKAGEEQKPMGWQEFRNFYAKCHNVLTRALISCWSEAEFMHNKNAIIVALQIINYFPLMESNGNSVENAVKKLQSGAIGEITGDLNMMCTSFLASLERRKKSRPYVSPAVFHSAGARAAAAKQRAAQAIAANAAANGNAQAANGTPSKAIPGLPESKQENTATPEPMVHPVPVRPNLTRPQPGSSASSPVVVPSRSNTPVSGAPGSSMGPPANGLAGLTDPDRAAARARKFGTLHRPAPPPPSRSTPAAAAAPVASTETPALASKDKDAAAGEPGTSTGPARGKSPTPSGRATPPSRSRREGSVESRASERSRSSRRPDKRDRDQEREKRHRDRDRDGHRDSHRDREKDRGRDRDRERDERTGDDKAESIGKRSTGDDDKKRQEDLLQARHDKLSATGGSERRDSSGRRRETEKEREERKERERKEDREKDRSHRSDDGHKRKRDEERRDERRGDRERRRHDEREPGKDRDARDRERDRERSDRRSDRDDRKRDERGDRQRRDRDPRDAPRDAHRRSPAPETAESSSRPAPSAPREEERLSRLNNGSQASRVPHVLPPRPAGNSNRGGASAEQSPAQSHPQPQLPGNLMARLGPPGLPGIPGLPPIPGVHSHASTSAPPAAATVPDRRPSPPHMRTAERTVETLRRGSLSRDESRRDDSRRDGGERKRALEDPSPALNESPGIKRPKVDPIPAPAPAHAPVSAATREDSPGMRRVKIDRSKARPRKEGSAGGGRMFQAAMGGAKKDT
ncbi:hypothetical protein IAT38_000538 [Cryptococcus sp. DSM 104549]